MATQVVAAKEKLVEEVGGCWAETAGRKEGHWSVGHRTHRQEAACHRCLHGFRHGISAWKTWSFQTHFHHCTCQRRQSSIDKSFAMAQTREVRTCPLGLRNTLSGSTWSPSSNTRRWMQQDESLGQHFLSRSQQFRCFGNSASYSRYHGEMTSSASVLEQTR